MDATETKTYTPPSNGMIFMNGDGAANSYVSVICGKIQILQQSSSKEYVSLIFPATKGIDCTLYTNAITGTNRKTYFVPYL